MVKRSGFPPPQRSPRELADALGALAAEAGDPAPRRRNPARRPPLLAREPAGSAIPVRPEPAPTGDGKLQRHRWALAAFAAAAIIFIISATSTGGHAPPGSPRAPVSRPPAAAFAPTPLISTQAAAPPTTGTAIHHGARRRAHRQALPRATRASARRRVARHGPAKRPQRAKHHRHRRG